MKNVNKASTLAKSSVQTKSLDMSPQCYTKSRKYNIRHSKLRNKEASVVCSELKQLEFDGSDDNESASNSMKTKRGQK